MRFVREAVAGSPPASDVQHSWRRGSLQKGVSSDVPTNDGVPSERKQDKRATSAIYIE